MTFPGMNGDIKLLADIAQIDAKRNNAGEERALDLIATIEHLKKNGRFKTGELVNDPDTDEEPEDE